MRLKAQHGRVLHAVGWAPAVRALQNVGIAVFALVVLVLVLVLGSALASSAQTGAALAMLLIICLLALLMGAYLVVLSLRSSRAALVLTTRGVLVRGLLRTRWLPWADVERVESADHPYWRRATCLVTRNGQCVLAVVTSHQYTFLRGDSSDPAVKDPRIPLLPTRLAIDVHRQWLRGEFRDA